VNLDNFWRIFFLSIFGFIFISIWYIIEFRSTFLIVLKKLTKDYVFWYNSFCKILTKCAKCNISKVYKNLSSLNWKKSHGKKFVTIIGSTQENYVKIILFIKFWEILKIQLILKNEFNCYVLIQNVIFSKLFLKLRKNMFFSKNLF
jgi:hypothetical protein